MDGLKACTQVGVIAHLRPEGDAIGSTIAMGLGLQAMGKQVRFFNEDELPARYAFLGGSELIEAVPASCPPELELLICLDNGAWKRLGDRAIEVFAPAANPQLKLINIDHHGSNEMYGQLNIVEAQAAATGCIVYDIIGEMGIDMTPAMAAALYTAISTDTGSFQYGSTTPAVMRAAAHLIECGVDVQDINRRLYQEVPLSTLMVNREVLNHMVVEMEGQLSHYTMTAATKHELGINLEDTKDLVDIIRVIEGVKASIIFEDLEDGRVRMSLRSKDPRVNVARVAEQFGGGGHAMAAGIRMRGTLEECQERVLAALRQEISSAS